MGGTVFDVLEADGGKLPNSGRRAGLDLAALDEDSGPHQLLFAGLRITGD